MYKSKCQGVLGMWRSWRRGPARSRDLGVRCGGRCIVLLDAPPVAALAAGACVRFEDRGSSSSPVFLGSPYLVRSVWSLRSVFGLANPSHYLCARVRCSRETQS